MASIQVLIIDDDPLVREVLTRWLRSAGYTSAAVDSATAGWSCLQEDAVELVSLDLRMEGGSGLDLLDRINRVFSDTAVLMLTGERDANKAIRALTQGAYAYLIKPVEREQFLISVRNGLERRRLLIENREFTQRLQEKVREQTQTIRLAHEETIYRLLSASAFRDNETGAHIRRTGLFSEALARAAGWEPVRAEQLRIAAPMHDIGKIGIPDAILRKPGKLTAEEFDVMKTHAAVGARMLDASESDVLQLAQEIALCHHERWDGKGYPRGLAGSAIPECARIVAIVDVYDALSHDRVYRPAFADPETLGMMLDGSGTQFDPHLLECFLAVLPEIRGISNANPDDACHQPLGSAADSSQQNRPIPARS